MDGTTESVVEDIDDSGSFLCLARARDSKNLEMDRPVSNSTLVSNTGFTAHDVFHGVPSSCQAAASVTTVGSLRERITPHHSSREPIIIVLNETGYIYINILI